MGKKNPPQNNPLRKIPHYFIIFLKQRAIFVELFLRFPGGSCKQLTWSYGKY
jgi:hypothetical protein